MQEHVPLLTMRNVSKQYPGVLALSDVDFTLEAGSIHALLGENGAGKSTLIKVLTGVEPMDVGNICLEGTPICASSPQHAQQLGISTVYQEVNLCTNLTVSENIFIGREPMKNGRIDWATMNKQAKALLKRFDLDISVTHTLDAFPVAVQQMVAIARAVDISAKVLILDEPTSSLTSVEVKKLFDMMQSLKREGMGIVFVTHFLDQVYAVSDHITVLRNGKLVGQYVTSELPKIQLIGKMIGKEYSEFEISHDDADKAGSQAKVLLSTKRMSTTNMSPFTLEIRQGEVLGLAGLLGSGRSETLRALFAIDRRTGGVMELSGKDVHLNSPSAALRDGLALCSENRKTESIVADMSVRDNIILALQTKRGMFHRIHRKEAEKIADEYIHRLQIKTSSQDQTIGSLSGGNQQKVILARCLATDPSILMLDEPTRGIDIGTKAEIQRLVVELASQGMAVVFVSSEIDEELRTCSRLLIYYEQEIKQELTGSDINENAVMKAIAGGETA